MFPGGPINLHARRGRGPQTLNKFGFHAAAAGGLAARGRQRPLGRRRHGAARQGQRPWALADSTRSAQPGAHTGQHSCGCTSQADGSADRINQRPSSSHHALAAPQPLQMVGVQQAPEASTCRLRLEGFAIDRIVRVEISERLPAVPPAVTRTLGAASPHLRTNNSAHSRSGHLAVPPRPR